MIRLKYGRSTKWGSITGDNKDLLSSAEVKNACPVTPHHTCCHIVLLNLLTPNVNYSGRTAPLTSKVAFYIFIQQIYVLNILNMVYILRFFSSKCSLFHNSNVFGSCIIHILYTECAKIKKNNSGAKRLIKHLDYFICFCDSVGRRCTTQHVLP